MRFALLHIILLLACTAAFGQVKIDSIQRIDTVEVSSNSIKLKIVSNPFNIQLLDSTDKVYYQSSSLGNLLQENTGVYIKSYGPGALATTGFRGMGASQTKVFWNGIPINSGMNGTIDLTNLPMGVFDGASVSFGGNTIQAGSGSFGGAVNVGSTPKILPKGLSGLAWYEVGSFGTHSTALKLSASTGKFTSKIGFLCRRARNDFEFKNTTVFGEPNQKQEYANFVQYAAIAELYNKHLNIMSFVSKTDRQIPPTMLSANSFQNQSDWLGLIKLETKNLLNPSSHLLHFESSYKFDEINYQSKLPEIDSKSQTHAAMGLLRYGYFLSKQNIQFHAKLEHTSIWAVTDNFDGIKYQPISGFIGSSFYQSKDNKWNVILIFRQELVYNKLSPFLPSFNVRYGPLKKPDFYFSTNIFRNYRYPTLNDRYWSVGGNPDLQQEKGWGTEGKVGYDKSFEKGFKLETSINAYYLDVQNWILWLPESSTGIWTPENVKRVKSRGVEALIKVDGKKNNWTYRFTANYHFNKATNETSGGAIGSSSGKLLIYTPKHLGNISGMVGYKGYYLQYRQHLCGMRYITSDNGQSLQSFTTGDLRIGKDFGKKLKGLSLYIAAENLWNAQYQNIVWRPMPGRSFNGGVRYEFAVKKK
jgi:iron complex outermembrane receptor protein